MTQPNDSNSKVKRSNDESLRTRTILIHGEPKVGKTSLVRTLGYDDPERVLVLDADRGTGAIEDTGVMVYPYESGKLYAELHPWRIEAAKDQYDWIIVDGLNHISDAITEHEFSKPTKSGGERGIDAWRDAIKGFEFWTKAVRDLSGKKGIFFITHSREQEATIWPDAASDKMRRKMVGWFDLVGALRLFTEPEMKDGQPTGKTKTKRMIQFNQAFDPRYVCGDRLAVCKDMEAPDLGAIIKKANEKAVKKETK